MLWELIKLGIQFKLVHMGLLMGLLIQMTLFLPVQMMLGEFCSFNL
jgi:hypothetical protein|uniref:Uncharacterized protein n=1 Tax=Picea glauca TaxID=3330 RepID=A0A101LVD4_PICGL|nr:hypothetical protein ABT39_MTgene2149 [Picea glauca]QHR90743.1 hypothetical protein Q903MT_gene4769 [Picea sitchensis]